MGSSPNEEWMDLADAVALLRDQIAEAKRRVDDPSGVGDKGIKLTVDEVTVELGLELARTTVGGGGLKFGVAGFGANVDGKRENGRKATHKITMKITAEDADGRPVKIRDTK